MRTLRPSCGDLANVVVHTAGETQPAVGERTARLPETRRKHVPLRSCIACRRKLPKRELIRVVRTPEGTIEIDPKGKRSGRGAYLCHQPQCWEQALQPRRLGQALHCPVSAEDVAALRAVAAVVIDGAAVASPTATLGGAERS